MPGPFAIGGVPVAAKGISAALPAIGKLLLWLTGATAAGYVAKEAGEGSREATAKSKEKRETARLVAMLSDAKAVTRQRTPKLSRGQQLLLTLMQSNMRRPGFGGLEDETADDMAGGVMEQIASALSEQSGQVVPVERVAAAVQPMDESVGFADNPFLFGRDNSPLAF